MSAGGEPLIRPLDGHAEMEACVELQHEIWGRDFDQFVSSAVLWAAQRTGGVASGAFDDAGGLVGFVFGLTGVQDGTLIHWSDMLAVRPEWRGRGLGMRLKLHQREVLRTIGVQRVYWTFEPLEARNAWLNFGRLGVRSREYLRDVYGATGSPLHAGIGTDRLVVEWGIGGGTGAGAGAGAGTGEVAAVGVGSDGVSAKGPVLGLDSGTVQIAVPGDIQTLKAEWPAVALEWRTVTRAAFEHYLGRGYTVEGVKRDARGLLYELRRSS